MLSIAGTIGKSCIVPVDAPELNCNQAVCLIRPIENKLLNNYLQHWLESAYAHKQYSGKKVTGVISNLSLTMVRNLQIPLPPLPEQKRIATILDAADALRNKRRQSIAELDTLLQATFLDMFGDPVTNPKGWGKRLLGEVAIRITKGQSPKWQGFEYQESGALFVTSENVREGVLDISKPKFVAMEFDQKLKSSSLENGDLLINLVGASIGRSCMFTGFNGKANINQAVSVVTIPDGILSTYILQMLQTCQGKTLLTGNVVDAARANISLKNLKELWGTSKNPLFTAID